MDKQKELPKMTATDTQTINHDEYVGKKVKIERMSIESGNYGKYLKVETEPVAKLDDKDLRVSRIYNLLEENGQVTFSKTGELQKTLDTHKVEDYRDLIGVEVVILKESKNNKDWLTFR